MPRTGTGKAQSPVTISDAFRTHNTPYDVGGRCLHFCVLANHGDLGSVKKKDESEN
jgi:hypothetical protein